MAETRDGKESTSGDPIWDDEPRIIDFSQLRLDPEPVPETVVETRKPEKGTPAKRKKAAVREIVVHRARPERPTDEQLANRKLARDIALGTFGALVLGAAVYGVGLLL